MTGFARTQPGLSIAALMAAISLLLPANATADDAPRPGGFYADLRTTAFPGGAARAQLHLLTHAVATSGIAAVQGWRSPNHPAR